jgi:hypothetical protein
MIFVPSRFSPKVYHLDSSVLPALRNPKYKGKQAQFPQRLESWSSTWLSCDLRRNLTHILAPLSQLFQRKLLLALSSLNDSAPPKLWVHSLLFLQRLLAKGFNCEGFLSGLSASRNEKVQKPSDTPLLLKLCSREEREKQIS